MWYSKLNDLKRTHRATRVTVIPTVIGVLGTTSKNTKVWYERLSVPDVFGSGHRGGSTERVQGVRTPPPGDGLRFSFTTGILQKKKLWFIGVEVEQETKAPPPKKNPGSAPGRCQPILQKVLCLCGIAAETWLRIPRKRTGEDHTIIINTIFIKN